MMKARIALFQLLVCVLVQIVPLYMTYLLRSVALLKGIAAPGARMCHGDLRTLRNKHAQFNFQEH